MKLPQFEVGQEVEASFGMIGTIKEISKDGYLVTIETSHGTYPEFAQFVELVVRCSICGERIVGNNKHNADPVNKGWCCTECNLTVVIPARLEQLGL